jgi:hypothetical protein
VPTSTVSLPTGTAVTRNCALIPAHSPLIVRCPPSCCCASSFGWSIDRVASAPGELATTASLASTIWT